MASIFLIHASFGVIPAETSPIPLMVALVLFHLRSGFDKNLIYSTLFLMLASALAIINEIVLIDIIEQLAVYLQVLFVGYYFYKFGIQGINIKLLYFILFFHCIVGISQYFEIVAINNLISVLIPRTETLIDNISGRGVPFLSTEPSEALQYILLPIFLLLVKGGNSKLNIILVWTTIVLTVFLSSSGTSFLSFMILIFFSAFFYLGFTKFIIFLIFCFGLFLSIDILDLLIAYEVENRAVSIAIQLLDSNPSYLFELISQISGFRFALDYASFSSFLYLQPAYGVGSWTVNSLYSLSQAGIDINNFADFMYLDTVPLKPVSLLGLLILEFGVLGILIVFYLAYVSIPAVNKFLKTKNENFSKPFLLLAVFKVSFLVIVGNPTSVAIIALSIFILNEKVESNYRSY